MKTSARNVFQGRIISLRRSGLLVEVVLSTAGGLRITALITDESCRSLALCDGKLVNASVKAPWVMVQQDLPQAERAHGVCASAAENSFPALVERVREDDMVAEILAALPRAARSAPCNSRIRTAACACARATRSGFCSRPFL